MEIDAPEIMMIHSSMTSEITREQAPSILKGILHQNPNILLKYWKKRDKELYYITPPDGACGYYALAQVYHRMTHGNTINLNTYAGRNYASNILTEIASNNSLSTSLGLNNIHYAIEWIRNKSDNSDDHMIEQYHLSGEDFYEFSTNLQTSLFAQPDLNSRLYTISMPDDIDHVEWLTLFCTSFLTGNCFSLQEIERISTNSQFVQVSGYHYWLFPILLYEELNCQQAIDTLAFSIWDTIHGLNTPKIKYPMNTSNITINVPIEKKTLKKEGILLV